MSSRLYLPLCCVRTAPEVSEKEGSYALRFYRWFLESFKSCLLLLVALPGLINTLAQLLVWRPLLWFLWRGDEGTWCRVISQHNIAGLISGITFIVLFSQEKPLRWKKIHTHARTHTHTHTHANTHTHTHTEAAVIFKGIGCWLFLKWMQIIAESIKMNESRASGKNYSKPIRLATKKES